MTRRMAVGSFGLLLACLTGLALFCWAGPREATWKEVEEATRKGQPKTAVEILDRIYAAALKDKNYPEAIKAVGKKIALEGIIQGNKPEEKITRMQAEIAKSPKEMQPVMTAILAHWYWQYFQHNQWRFMQRTATAQPPGDDILSWDLPRIMAEIDKHFTAALANEAELKKIPIAQYDELLDKGTLPDTYRPTLYDFLAFEALKFYSSGEQAGAKAEDAFELTADSPIFGSVEEFMAWDVKTPDAASLTVRAIRLYQNVLKFHKDDKEQSVFLDANLDRLHFGYNKAVGEDKNTRYKAALEKFVEKLGRPRDFDPCQVPVGLGASSRRRASRSPQAGQAGQRSLSQEPVGRHVLQPDGADHCAGSAGQRGTGLERALADHPAALPQRHPGPPPPHPGRLDHAHQK